MSGCSATGEAVLQNVLTNPAAFLDILREQLGGIPTGADRRESL